MQNILHYNDIFITYFSEYDLCDLLAKISDADCAAFLKADYIPCHCPIPPGTYTLSPHTFNIPETGPWTWIPAVSISHFIVFFLLFC